MADRDDTYEGLTRREVLTGIGAAALLSMLPKSAHALALDEGARAPKGVIFVVGDGMPLGVIRGMHEIATRVFGERDTALYQLMRDGKSRTAYMGTASLTSIVTDSAPASVAWATGVKTANRMLASLPDGTPLTTILELAKMKRLATGLVTTTRLTHATPAAWVSHNQNRDAEDDIALDYLRFEPDVLLGGGSRHFDPARRADRRDLFSEFSARGYDVVRTRTELRSLAVSHRKILGTFNSSHIDYYVDRINNPALGGVQPTLAEMTTVALNRLGRDKNGFVLQIEAGRIDHASHANDAWGAIMDTYELDLTLRVLRSYLAENPNVLLIVASDHGNSGWGINGTGPEYNEATQALMKLSSIKASFERISPQLRGKTPAQIKQIVASTTGFDDLTDAEAQMLYDSLQPGYKPYPGDFSYLAEPVLARILAHNDRSLGIRRGNVGFTSNNHTAEDQILMVHGTAIERFQVRGWMDNTEVFELMARHLGIQHRNPSMSPKQAARYVRPLDERQWALHMEKHVR